MYKSLFYVHIKPAIAQINVMYNYELRQKYRRTASISGFLKSHKFKKKTSDHAVQNNIFPLILCLNRGSCVRIYPLRSPRHNQSRLWLCSERERETERESCINLGLARIFSSPFSVKRRLKRSLSQAERQTRQIRRTAGTRRGSFRSNAIISRPGLAATAPGNRYLSGSRHEVRINLSEVGGRASRRFRLGTEETADTCVD